MSNNQFDFCDSPDLAVICGSHLYGVSTPTSDEDVRGFVVEPSNYLIGIDNFEQKEYSDRDTVIYGLKKFFKILRAGNTNCLEVLFSNQIQQQTAIGKKVLAKRDLFISKTYYRAIRGFAMAEIRKARAVSLVMEHNTQEEADLFTELAGRYQLKRFEINDILDIVFNNREGDPRREVSSTRHLGDRRKTDVEKYGFSVKNAYHAIRLLDQGIELMNTGRLTFPRPIAAELIAIRNGQVTMVEIEKRFAELDAGLKKAAENSRLPENADPKPINDLYVEIVMSVLAEDAIKDYLDCCQGPMP